MDDQTQQTPAQTQAVSPEPEGRQELQVTYPCQFPKCKLVLDVDALYVPDITWINRQVSRYRKVTDWFTQASEAEMAEYARCKHHALESVVGLDYNRRMSITMASFGDVARLARHKVEQAQFEKDQKAAQVQFEKDQKAEAYRAQHQREKDERQARREAAKRSRPAPVVTPAAAKPKNYGDAHARVAVEPASNKKKGKKQKDDGKKKGGR